MMTRFEREDWNVVAGNDLTVFRTPLGLIAVSICYDSEFPLLARSLAEAGVELLLVPSATEALAGFTRVKNLAGGRLQWTRAGLPVQR